MKIYDKYTAFNARQIAVIYRCSKCGKKQVHFLNVVGKGETTRTHSFSSSETVSAKRDASEDARYDLNRKIKMVQYGIPMGKYQSLDARIKCLNCGHKEPWSFYRNELISTIRLFAIISLFLLIIFLDKHHHIWMLPGVIIIVFTIILDCLLRANKKQRIKLLPGDSIPTVIIGKDSYKHLRNDTESINESYETYCKYIKDYIDTHNDATIIPPFIVDESKNIKSFICKETVEKNYVDSINVQNSMLCETYNTDIPKTLFANNQQEYNHALSLLKMPTKENTSQAVAIMNRLAEEEYTPAIQWMAEYSESVLKDYQSAVVWYKKLSNIDHE